MRGDPAAVPGARRARQSRQPDGRSARRCARRCIRPRQPDCAIGWCRSAWSGASSRADNRRETMVTLSRPGARIVARVTDRRRAELGADRRRASRRRSAGRQSPPSTRSPTPPERSPNRPGRSDGRDVEPVGLRHGARGGTACARAAFTAGRPAGRRDRCGHRPDRRRVRSGRRRSSCRSRPRTRPVDIAIAARASVCSRRTIGSALRGATGVRRRPPTSTYMPSTIDDHALGAHAYAARMVAAVATLGSGGPMGLEGPSMYSGAVVGWNVQRRLPRIVPRRRSARAPGGGRGGRRRGDLQGAGDRCGVRLEVPYQDDLARRMLLPALVSSRAGYLVFVAINGTEPLFPIEGRSRSRSATSSARSPSASSPASERVPSPGCSVTPSNCVRAAAGR